MGTPSRTSILTAIDTALSGITVAGGYKTTVDTVEPFLRSRDDVTEGERPYLGFGFGTETYEHQAYHNMRISVPWAVVGYIDSSGLTWAQASAAMNNLIDDVIVAIMSDDTLGGYATQTILVDSMTSEADPDRQTVPGDGGAIVVNFRTTYYRETTAS